MIRKMADARPWFLDRRDPMATSCRGVAPRAIVGCVLWLGLACAGERPDLAGRGAATPCGLACALPSDAGDAGDAGDATDGQGAGLGTNLVPLPKIRFQTLTPTDEFDYPFGAEALPPGGIIPGSTVYLSAEGSFDPEGAEVSYFWNVQDPTGAYLTVTPEPSATRVSFSAARVGSHAITLEVVEKGPLGQIGQTTIKLIVAPQPCAPDGVSPPCSDDLEVPGGTFLAGAPDGRGDESEHPAHTVTVAPFALDKFEVTVGRFRRYADVYAGEPPPDGAGAHPLIPGSGWQPQWKVRLPARGDVLKVDIAECGGAWTQKVGASEARPISCVTWYQAFAFCAWEGKRLPTEAEWEYAAAGGSEQRPYPWGAEEPSVERVVFGCLFDGDPSCADADLPVAGSLAKGAGRWGHLDLAGSLWEWTLDVYAPYTSAPCDNCAVVIQPVGAGRVFRGGDFRFGDPTWLTVTTRLGILPGLPDDRRGFRCARSLSAQ